MQKRVMAKETVFSSMEGETMGICVSATKQENIVKGDEYPWYNLFRRRNESIVPHIPIINHKTLVNVIMSTMSPI